MQAQQGSLRHHLQDPRHRNGLDAHGQRTAHRGPHKDDAVQTHTYSWTITRPRKGWAHTTGSPVRGPRNYRTKWSTPDRRRWEPFWCHYMWDLSYDSNELVYETGKDSQRKRAVAATGKGNGAGSGWFGQRPTVTHGTDKRGLIVCHGEVYPHP